MTLAKNQSRLGHIPSLVHDPENRGASDTTPLFLMAVGLFRKVTGETDFMRDGVNKAMTWMEYQSPTDSTIVAQLPTSDWRDEQWVPGYGLYVNWRQSGRFMSVSNHIVATSKEITAFLVQYTGVNIQGESVTMFVET